MSEAKKCDRCGRYGEVEGFGRVCVKDKFYGVNWDMRADLCEECYKKLSQWLCGEVEK